jgi:hypothetical protein
MAGYRASLSINVGPSASFDALAAITTDLKTMLDFAQEVQAVVDRNDAAYFVLRRRDFGPLLDDFDIAPGYVRSEFLASLISSGTPFLRSPAFERAVEQRLTEITLDRTVRVERILYLNPFDLHITFDGSGISKILEVFRDWAPRRREAEAIARQAEAEASSYEEDLRFKRDLHDAFRGALLSGELRIGSEEATRLLAIEIQRSLGSLVKADIKVELNEIRDDDADD